jgi:hypothetical protein
MEMLKMNIWDWDIMRILQGKILLNSSDIIEVNNTMLAIKIENSD